MTAAAVEVWLSAVLFRGGPEAYRPCPRTGNFCEGI